ncbi:MAG: type III pantothenate kinase [Clostridiales bacterium]|nr:type III pantothenate kinase [Clostridiales bacterium]
MIIVFDIGNTNIKIGLFEGDELVETLRIASSNKTGDEYWVLIKDMLALKNLSARDVKGAIISSVNPSLNYTFEHMVETYFGIKPMTVGAGLKTGLSIKYDNPKELGADRVAGCVAAYRLYGAPCIVIDCGTATTFNVVSGAGEFLGGAISFGLKAAAEALATNAARLPEVELAAPTSAIGKTTITNMQSGIIYGYSGMVESMVKRIKKEAGLPDAKVIATGGISDIVNKCVDVIDVVDRTLTLRGLNIIYGINADKRRI